MKVLFITNIEDVGFEEPLGVMYLAAAITRTGHRALLAGADRGRVGEIIDREHPDLLAFSAVTPSFMKLHQLAIDLKRRYPLPIVFGGCHPTYFPEIAGREGIDFVFRGECEETFTEFLDRMEKGLDYRSVDNLSYAEPDRVGRQGSVLRHNPLRTLTADLDNLSFPDRELLAPYQQFYHADVVSVIASRGCPYHCSYCYNNKFKEMYRDRGDTLRTRSVDNVIEECVRLKTVCRAKMIHFFDDIFPFKPAWIEEFSDKYAAAVGLPMIANTSFNVCSEHYIECLRRANCKCLLIGVETGNEQLREKILFRAMKNEDMIRKSERLHRADIRIYSQNLLGLPQGSLSHDLETLKLNIDLKADYAGAYLLQPYPGTAVEKIARDAGLLHNDEAEFQQSFYYGSPLQIPDKAAIERLRILFPVIVSFPFLYRLTRVLLRLPPAPFTFIGKLLHGYAIRFHILRYPMGLRKTIAYIGMFLARPINRIGVLRRRTRR